MCDIKCRKNSPLTWLLLSFGESVTRNTFSQPEPDLVAEYIREKGALRLHVEWPSRCVCFVDIDLTALQNWCLMVVIILISNKSILTRTFVNVHTGWMNFPQYDSNCATQNSIKKKKKNDDTAAHTWQKYIPVCIIYSTFISWYAKSLSGLYTRILHTYIYVALHISLIKFSVLPVSIFWIVILQECHLFSELDTVCHQYAGIVVQFLSRESIICNWRRLWSTSCLPTYSFLILPRSMDVLHRWI